MSDKTARDGDPQLDRLRALVEQALRRWDLDVTSITPIKVRENAVFRAALANGEQAVVRVHRYGYHSDAALRSEFTWMRALATSGIGVPEAIRSRAGHDFELVEAPGVVGARQVDVFRWIKGHQLGSVEASVGGDAATIDDQYQRIGVLMARMHNQAAGWQPPVGFERHKWNADGLVGEAPLWGRFWDLGSLTQAQRTLLIAVRDRCARDLAGYGTGPDRYGLIHADFVPENILVDGNDMRVIDFDDAGYGWYLFDIATSLYFITGDGVYGTARDALLRGYRGERALVDELARWLTTFLAVRGTTYLGWVHTRPDSETARELTPYLIERACAVAEEYLASS